MHFGAFPKLFSQLDAAAGIRSQALPVRHETAVRLPRAGAVAAFTHFV
jgi:hypothetical protein